MQYMEQGSVLNYCLKKYNDELIITNIEKDENIENKIKK